MVWSRKWQLLAVYLPLSCGVVALDRRYIDNSTGTPQVIIPGASSYNGLNLVPQMGWNNWNAFHCDVSEELVLETAQKMIDLGLRDLGYKTISMDDCWSIGRNSSGYIEPNRTSTTSVTDEN
jgi:alpha-galactosidase